ncbi:baseplate hub assembly chaperone [Aeromonas phage Riv-10]|nr:baseplate hub assembly chaperone [Aeromonas phage L9-6]APU02232.1 baseplate hub assembly chaperone [Aeromonas phage Riv-10]
MQIKMTIGGKAVETDMLTVSEYLGLVNSYSINSPEEAVNQTIESRFGELPKHLAEQAFVKLVALSKRKQIKMKTKCTCGIEHSFVVSPDAISVTSNDALTHRAGSVIINLRHPKMFEDRDPFEMVDRCLVSFEHDGQVISWDNASDLEKDLLFKQLHIDDIRQIVGKLSANKIYAVVPLSCECGNQWPAVIEGPGAILGALGVK